MKSFFSLTIAFLIFPELQAQQVADSLFNPPIISPAYERGTGPVVFVDEAHHNFHTLDGRYRSFGDLLEKDGYRLQSFATEFTESELRKGKILVISNALHESNIDDWSLPNPSAFTTQEIESVRDWVHVGGSLMLIADHMPFPGAAAELAAAFGFEFNNGFARDTTRPKNDFFRRQQGMLNANVITNGRSDPERVDFVVSFTGQAFRIPAEAEPLMLLNSNFISLMPDTAWAFRPWTKKIDVGGWSQGAYRKFGQGRVAVFGEAAMFSAQISGRGRKMGMNHPVASQNWQFLLNVIHWLDGILD